MTASMQEKTSGRGLAAGIDIGSTTTKIAVLDPEKGDILYSDYRRHHADQVQSVIRVMEELERRFPGETFRFCLTGSGAKPIAEGLGIPFAQEVAANAAALKRRYEKVGCAIELGGQDAKMIFFQTDPNTGALTVADMRMNGSCAGGTGAFIDEIASLLKVPVQEFNALAERGTCVYDISGRCGVYAKTDIQPLLNQGVAKSDLALSAFHAIAKQTIGGLAQGLEITRPVVFEGGPLTFNPALVRVFAQRLGLSKEEVLIPPHPELMVACGAAVCVDTMFRDRAEAWAPAQLLEQLKSGQFRAPEDQPREARPFFATAEERRAFEERNRKRPLVWKEPQAGEEVWAYLGIDSGSTTTKFVLMDDNEELLGSFYAPNAGEPLKVAKRALIEIRDRYRKAGATLHILAAGTTGYGEMLFAKAFQAEYHTVETVAHARAAKKYVADATFILDIGGQDMKAMWLDKGIITNILVNEACSSGCGSFLENFASSLGIPTKGIEEAAFASRHPAVLGSRCTVFMNSSIITEQRNGRSAEDIMAGLCRSIIENVFTKVIRLSNLDSLGDKIVVQGGTFENDAVLRAMEEYTGREVLRAPYPGLMGAIGMALIKKDYEEARKRGDSAGMQAANDGANAIRKQQGQKEQHASQDISNTANRRPSGSSGNRVTFPSRPSSSGSSGSRGSSIGSYDPSKPQGAKYNGPYGDKPIRDLDSGYYQKEAYYKQKYETARKNGDVEGMREANDGMNQVRNDYGLAAKSAEGDLSYVKNQIGYYDGGGFHYGSGGGSGDVMTSQGYSGYGSGYQLSQPEDFSDYIQQMYEAQRKSALSQLKSAYDKNVNAIDQSAVGVDAQYQNARNQAAGASELAARNFAEFAAASGLNSGAGGQAELSRNVTLQNNLNDLNQNEANFYSNIELQKAQAETDYNNAIAQAMANNDYAQAQAIYQEKVRVQEALRQQEIQQIQLDMQRYQFDQQQQLAQQQLNMQKQQYQDSINADKTGTLASYGSAFLEQGVMPSDEMLAAMGITASDAQSYINNLARVSTEPVLSYSQMMDAIENGNLTPNVLSAYEYYMGTGYQPAQAATYSAPVSPTGRNSSDSPTNNRPYAPQYDNGSLTSDQIKRMQAAIGVTADGFWGPESQQAVGGLSADDAWNIYGHKIYDPANPGLVLLQNELSKIQDTGNLNTVSRRAASIIQSYYERGSITEETAKRLLSQYGLYA